MRAMHIHLTYEYSILLPCLSNLHDNVTYKHTRFPFFSSPTLLPPHDSAQTPRVPVQRYTNSRIPTLTAKGQTRPDPLKAWFNMSLCNAYDTIMYYPN
jgi:hypothetical protein